MASVFAQVKIRLSGLARLRSSSGYVGVDNLNLELLVR
jgi:hypothetical protein